MEEFVTTEHIKKAAEVGDRSFQYFKKYKRFPISAEELKRFSTYLEDGLIKIEVKT